VKLEVHGLEVFGRHGVEDDERRDGQIFLYDLELEVGDAGSSDRIEDAVDYREVVARVQEVSDSHPRRGRCGRDRDRLSGRVGPRAGAEAPRGDGGGVDGR
jgi:dihydroneopterin aldolase